MEPAVRGARVAVRTAGDVQSRANAPAARVRTEPIVLCDYEAVSAARQLIRHAGRRTAETPRKLVRRDVALFLPRAWPRIPCAQVCRVNALRFAGQAARRGKSGEPVIHRFTCAVPVCLLLFPSATLAQDVVDLAADLIGRPYVWGAEGPNAFDCSGLTQYVYQKVGIDLPRRAISQSKVGDAAGRRLQRGDLVFFSTDTRQSLVTHVGLYEGGGMMIEASKRYGRVRRDTLSDPYWVERFMFARRVGSESVAREDPDVRDAPDADPPRGSSRAPSKGDRRRAVIRAVERVADVLFKLPRRDP